MSEDAVNHLRKFVLRIGRRGVPPMFVERLSPLGMGSIAQIRRLVLGAAPCGHRLPAPAAWEQGAHGGAPLI